MSVADEKARAFLCRRDSRFKQKLTDNAPFWPDEVIGSKAPVPDAQSIPIDINVFDLPVTTRSFKLAALGSVARKRRVNIALPMVSRRVP